MTEEHSRRNTASGIGDGIRSGIGILTAFKDALEETIQEAMDRGELSPDRARQAMRDTLHRFQESVDDARERFDFVPRKEFETVQSQVIDLRARVEALERRVYNPTDDSGIVFETE